MGDNLVVVDCETTGLHPGSHHRMIELAMVRVDRTGELVDVWSTLLRPDRDLGPTDVHGIRGRDVVDAPAFGDVLGEILDRLAGRVVVAHNARFDCLFLEHELVRAGIDKAPLPAICTMEVASRIGIGGGRARLADCCAELGMEGFGEHTAEGDALACASILRAYLRTGESVSDLVRGSVAPIESWPRSDRRAVCHKRVRASAVSEPTFLAELTRSADAPVGTNALEVAPYLDVLDRALEDRRLSPAELDDLASTAGALGLGPERVRALHVDYVGTLIALAFRDGVVTERERADLELVASALGVGGIDDALVRSAQRSRPEDSTSVAGIVGQSVCFTGTLLCEYEGRLVTREIAHRLAEEAGLVVLPRVTKKLDMLVVADPDSLSGKAQKARDYGVRVVAETAFWSMIGLEVS